MLFAKPLLQSRTVVRDSCGDRERRAHVGDAEPEHGERTQIGGGEGHDEQHYPIPDPGGGSHRTCPYEYGKFYFCLFRVYGHEGFCLFKSAYAKSEYPLFQGRTLKDWFIPVGFYNRPKNRE